MSDAPWTIRDALPEDESCLVSRWLKSYRNCDDVVARYGNNGGVPVYRTEDGVLHRHRLSRAEEALYAAVHRPIVMGLLACATVRVLCDPERVDYTPGRPSVVWAYSCTLPGRIFWVSMHRNIAQADPALAKDMVADLLSAPDLGTGGLIEFWPMDMYMVGLRPREGVLEGWKTSATWLKDMVAVSEVAQATDPIGAAVCRQVARMTEAA